MSGARTLHQTESAVHERLGNLDLDFEAMNAVSNLHRAASTVRNHFEQNVLKGAGLTWTAFVALWVIWIWKSMESRNVAEEVGVNKATLTGVVKNLESRGLVSRRVPAEDRRRVFLELTPQGEALMTELFPAINRTEQRVVASLSKDEVTRLGALLRTVLTDLETD